LELGLLGSDGGSEERLVHPQGKLDPVLTDVMFGEIVERNDDALLIVFELAAEILWDGNCDDNGNGSDSTIGDNCTVPGEMVDMRQ
jgi:hypothetical protein